MEKTAASPFAAARGIGDGSVSDERLMARVRSGDDRAFGWIYDRYAGSLLAFCQHLLGSREEAEDALQHVFVAAHRQMRLGSAPKQLRPWLYAVARNRCLSVLRARRETVRLEDVSEPAAGADASREAEQREDIRAVLADVAALPYAQREALLLAEVSAMSHDEIALTLGVRREKVKALVFQARQSLMVSREARETTCRDIQERLSVLRGGALRRGAIRRHVDRCPACAAFKGEVQRQRSLLAVALPVLPAAALKSTILTAANAGTAGVGAGAGAAAGGISAVAAAGSSTTAGGGLASLGSSALLTKVLATGAVAGIAIGGGTAVVRIQHTQDPAATAAPAARATSTTPATVRAASVSARSLISPPSHRPAPRGEDAHAQPRQPSPSHRRTVVQRETDPATAETVVTAASTPEAIGDSSAAVTVPTATAEPGTPASRESRAAEPSAATIDGATSVSSPETVDATDADPPPTQADDAEPDSPPGQANSAKPDSPPGQANSAKPDSPPGQANSAKPDTPPGQANSAKPDSPPGQANSAKPDSPPGQANSAKPDSPPGQANSAKPAS